MLARVGPSVFAVALGLVICGGVITAAGGDPALALAALFDGAFGSWDAASEVTVKTCPLLVTGLAVAVAFRASIWNIGAEGQLLIGAVIMAWLGTRSWPLPGWCTLPLALMAASAGGALWAGLAAMLKLRRRVSEVISTIMLNFIALALVSYLVHGPLMEAAGRYPQTDPVTLAMRLPRLVVSFGSMPGFSWSLRCWCSGGQGGRRGWGILGFRLSSCWWWCLGRIAWRPRWSKG